MASNENLISVFIPIRNRPELLKRAIDSVVAQDYRPIELIIIDNQSNVPVTLDSADIPCVIHSNGSLLNLPTNRIFGVSPSIGALVRFLDDHDYRLPAKLSMLARKLDGVDLCYRNTCMTGHGGREIGVNRAGTGGHGRADALSIRAPQLDPDAPLDVRRSSLRRE